MLNVNFTAHTILKMLDLQTFLPTILNFHITYGTVATV